MPIKPAFLRYIAAWFFSGVAAKVSAQKYQAIGGGSPLVEITLKQAAALQEELRRRGSPVKVFSGMRYGRPEIKDAFLNALAQGARTFIAVPLYPHYSITTTGSAFAMLHRICRKAAPLMKVDYVQSYETNPAYIEALAGKLRATLESARGGGEDARVIFSIHSLPTRMLKKDNLYIEQTKITAGLVADAAGVVEHDVAYQSGREGWLGPSVKETLEKLAGEGYRSFIVLPLSFTCDNIETLYDIDIKLRAEADKLGVSLRRTESLNDSPAFIGALADIVLEKALNLTTESTENTERKNYNQ